ncbi:MAG: HD domain-containing protein [Candidatus Brennerbacteria bacterium]|nr:HD domain-containing protein [Candidatus Brennerbacteria bacterium]
MTDKRFRKLIAFLKEIEKLKLVERRVKVSSRKRFENTAEHSWDLAMWVWVLFNDFRPKPNLLKTIKLVLMHDLVEIYAGDTFFFDRVGHKSKNHREEKAAKKLFAKLPPDLKKEFEKLWREFEEGKTRESKIARSVDKLQPMLQNIISGGYSWEKHKITEADIHKYKLDYMVHDKAILKVYQKLIKSAKQLKLISVH